MADVAVTVANATQFANEVPTEILVLTFTNTNAFTPKDGEPYYFVVTLTEAAASGSPHEFVFKLTGAGTEIAASTATPFTVENTYNFTAAATPSKQSIYYTPSA